MGQSIVGFCIRTACLVAAVVTALSCSTTPKPQRNLLLISIDTLAPARMSVYGAERDNTPSIGKLSEKAVRFTQAFSPSPWTLPAHASMLSGMYPSSLAADPNHNGLYTVQPLLAERFRKAGFSTGAFTGGAYVSAAYGANAGFDEFEEDAGVEQAVKWLESRLDDRFFLFFHTYVVHQPYLDRRFVNGLDGGRLTDIYTEADNETGGELHVDVCCRSLPFTEDEHEFVRALYDGGVARADEMVGQLLDALDRAGLAEATTVIVTSDHGEEFWEHTGRGAYHGHTLYDELLRVPLIWYDPEGNIDGRVVDEPVNLIDLVPTIVHRFALEEPQQPAEFDGLDLSPLLDGEPWGVQRPMFGEGVTHGPARYSVRDALGKLILTPDPSFQLGEGTWMPVSVRAAEEFYLPEDVGEGTNRAEQHANSVARLSELLADHWAAAVKQNPSNDQTPIDPKVLERLRSLGYIR